MTILVLSVLALGCFAAGWICGAQREAMRLSAEVAHWRDVAGRAIKDHIHISSVAVKNNGTVAGGAVEITGISWAEVPICDEAARSVVMRFEEPAGPKN